MCGPNYESVVNSHTFVSILKRKKTNLDVARNLPLGENCKWRTNA